MKTRGSVVIIKVVCFLMNMLGERVIQDLPSQCFENPWSRHLTCVKKSRLGLRLRVLVVVL